MKNRIRQSRLEADRTGLAILAAEGDAHHKDCQHDPARPSNRWLKGIRDSNSRL